MAESMEYDVSTSSNKKDGYVKKKILWVVIFALLVLVILTGILSGVVAAKKARQETEAKYKKQTKGTVTTTTTATTTSYPVTTSANPSTTNGPCTGAWCSVRLPNNIIPSHYNLSITANVDALNYTGIQTIEFTVNKPTKVVLVHIKKIEIDAAAVSDSKSKLNIAKTFYYPPNEYFVVVLEKNMIPGDHRIVLHFHANVSKVLTGFYNSSYQDGNKEKRLLTTKFQPTDARKAFPCLDEPDLKATFTVTVTHPITYKARSNTPGSTKENPAKSNAVTTFQKTVKMSTYLICFIISQFECKYSDDTGIGKNVTLSIWSQPAFINSTQYAFSTSKEMLTYFEEFLGYPYPMPKLDMFAIPDYGSGATEHWGIITYRESRLLYTPGQSSPANQRSTAGIIAHECAHLWFGNLVTCKWWDDLWVQEGMASYLEYYGMNNSHPEWNMMDKFLIIDWKTGISLDALASSHPISQKVDHPRQIKEMFDSITYNKGSSLFQMLDYYLGVEKFREGLTHYLVTNQYKGATVNDLWEAFSQVSGLNITKIMNTWTYQMGFPVVNISKNNDGTSFTLTQQHFLIDPRVKDLPKSIYNYKWIIPFTYATSDDLTERHVLLFDNKTAQINSTATWILGNFNHRGFYRVNYDDNGWKEIFEQIKKDYQVFSVTDRAGLTDDAFQLARAGQLNYSVPLELVNTLENDTSAIVWNMILTNLDYLDVVLSSQNIYEQFKSFVVSKIRPMYKKYGKAYLSTACGYGVQEAIMTVMNYFKDWKDNDAEIPPEIRSTVYYYAVANGDHEDWDFVYNKFLTSKDSSQRGKLQAALGATKNIWILRKWLQKTINTTIVRSQDTAYVIARIASNNPIGKYVAWSFVEENWEAIMNIAKENNFHVARLTSGLTSQFSTEYDLKEAKRLWRRYPNAGTGAQARQQGIEKIKANIYWLKQNYATVEKWLRNTLTR